MAFTGSSPRAQNGTLTIVAGGTAEDVARAEPLPRIMGELVVHVGERGQGEMLEIINNSLAAANAVAVGEALESFAGTCLEPPGATGQGALKHKHKL